MALTRKMLRAMGIEDEKIDQIIEAHGETVDALKADRDKYKADSEKLTDAKAELEELKAKSGNGYKDKYDALKSEFDTYKADQTAKEAKTAKETAYKAVLKAAGIPEKRFDAICRVMDFDTVELDEKGGIKDADALTKAVKTDWADFIPTTTEKGVDTKTPPANNGKTMTKADIVAIKDRDERRQAIAENIELFE